MHAYLNFMFKLALYSSALVIKLCNYYYDTVSQSCSFPLGMPTFKTEALRLVSNVQLVKYLLL